MSAATSSTQSGVLKTLELQPGVTSPSITITCPIKNPRGGECSHTLNVEKAETAELTYKLVIQLFSTADEGLKYDIFINDRKITYMPSGKDAFLSDKRITTSFLILGPSCIRFNEAVHNESEQTLYIYMLKDKCTVSKRLISGSLIQHVEKLKTFSHPSGNILKAILFQENFGIILCFEENSLHPYDEGIEFYFTKDGETLEKCESKKQADSVDRSDNYYEWALKLPGQNREQTLCFFKKASNSTDGNDRPTGLRTADNNNSFSPLFIDYP